MRLVRSLFCALLLGLLGSGSAFAQLYSSTSVGPGSCLSPAGTNAATDITTPAGTAYQITSATVSIRDAAAGSQLTVSVYSDAGGAPGASVAPLGTVLLTGAGATTLTVTPGGPVPLTPGTRYWIVVSTNSAGACNVSWDFGTGPAGTFTHAADATYPVGGPWTPNPGANFATTLAGGPVGAGAGGATTAVPTLSQWALLLLGGLLALVAFRQTRRRGH